MAPYNWAFCHYVIALFFKSRKLLQSCLANLCNNFANHCKITPFKPLVLSIFSSVFYFLHPADLWVLGLLTLRPAYGFMNFLTLQPAGKTNLRVWRFYG